MLYLGHAWQVAQRGSFPPRRPQCLHFPDGETGVQKGQGPKPPREPHSLSPVPCWLSMTTILRLKAGPSSMPRPFTLSPSKFKDKAPSLGACLILTPCPVGRAWMHLLHMRGVVPHPMLPPGGQRLGLVPGLPRMGPAICGVGGVATPGLCFWNPLMRWLLIAPGGGGWGTSS